MLPESHGPTILARRARALRQQGHIQVFVQEELESSTLWDLIRIHLLRPASELSHQVMRLFWLMQNQRCSSTSHCPREQQFG